MHVIVDVCTASGSVTGRGGCGCGFVVLNRTCRLGGDVVGCENRQGTVHSSPLCSGDTASNVCEKA